MKREVPHMISRKPLVALVVVGLLGSAPKAHAGWYRVLGSSARQQETNEELVRRVGKFIRRAPAPKSYDDRATRRFEDRRVMAARASHEYKPLVGRSAAPARIIASRSLARTEQLPTIAERLGGSHPQGLLANNADRVIKHYANPFLKSTTANLYSPWASQWKGKTTANISSAQHLFVFVN
jgi:hypothetical protein